MKPGRELDELVAKKVMGYKYKVLEYSTDIAAAWEVVEKMKDNGYEIIINVNTCEIKMTYWNDAGQAARGVKIFGDSIAMGICLAVLKEFGVEV